MCFTSTFKHRKVAYRDEGYDPLRIDDPLYFLEGDRYVRFDADLHKRIEAGEVGAR